MIMIKIQTGPNTTATTTTTTNEFHFFEWMIQVYATSNLLENILFNPSTLGGFPSGADYGRKSCVFDIFITQFTTADLIILYENNINTHQVKNFVHIR